MAFTEAGNGMESLKIEETNSDLEQVHEQIEKLNENQKEYPHKNSLIESADTRDTPVKLREDTSSSKKDVGGFGFVKNLL